MKIQRTDNEQPHHQLQHCSRQQHCSHQNTESSIKPDFDS